MLMDIRMIAAETRAIEYVQDHHQEFFTEEKAKPERRTFDLPQSIWWTMFLSYAVFFAGITIATGHSRGASFMIIVSAGYFVMYFGTAAALNSVGAAGRPASGASEIETATGKLSYGAAFAQILSVPLVIAFFGCCIAIVKAVVAS